MIIKLNKIVLTILIMFLITLTMGNNAFATSWASMDSKELINKAEIIVEGKYKVDSGKNSIGMWVPSEFIVDRYYRGKGGRVIQASIEQFDVQNSLDYQKQGGKYVLFLEKDPEGSRLWVPVGGPNGMIRIKNGTVEGNGLYDSQYIKNFLLQHEATKPSNLSNTTNILILLGVILILSVFIVIRKRI